MKFTDSTKINRKSGVAKWRDVLCLPPRNKPPPKPTNLGSEVEGPTRTHQP